MAGYGCVGPPAVDVRVHETLELNQLGVVFVFNAVVGHVQRDADLDVAADCTHGTGSHPVR